MAKRTPYDKLSDGYQLLFFQDIHHGRNIYIYIIYYEV
jgi:hypothetical protein